MPLTWRGIRKAREAPGDPGSLSRGQQDPQPSGPVCLLLGPLLRAWAGVGWGSPRLLPRTGARTLPAHPRVTAGGGDREALALLRAAPGVGPHPHGVLPGFERQAFASLGLQMTLGAIYGTSST